MEPSLSLVMADAKYSKKLRKQGAVRKGMEKLKETKISEAISKALVKQGITALAIRIAGYSKSTADRKAILKVRESLISEVIKILQKPSIQEKMRQIGRCQNSTKLNIQTAIQKAMEERFVIAYENLTKPYIQSEQKVKESHVSKAINNFLKKHIIQGEAR